MVQGPLKALIAHFPAFQYCSQSSCGKDCVRFHPSVEEEGVNLVILDVFAWRWMDATGRAAQAKKAAAFSIMVRVPRSATTALLQLSGTDGFYSELRESDSQQHASDKLVWTAEQNKYAVVWLKGDFDDARHKLHTLQHALHLVRFHSKFGLRCLKSHEAELHQAIYPGRLFVNCSTPLQLETGPWPFGITRQAIAEVIKSMSWTAKPLRPIQGGNHGRYWLVGSESKPPSTVVAYQESFITITQVKTGQMMKPVPNVVASMKTLQRINAGSDPWLKSDPWSGYHSMSSAPSPPVPASSDAALNKLEELESRLSSKFSEQLKEQMQSIAADDLEMEVDGNRFDQMESHIAELQARSTRFEKWFHEAGEQMTNMKQHMAQQDSNMEQLTQQVASNSSALNGLQTQIKSDLQTALSAQTASLESMLLAQLAKKSRHE